MADLLSVRIITPGGVVFSHDAESVTLPGAEGEMQVLHGHVALITTVVPGRIVVKDGAGSHVFATGAGFVEVSGGNRVAILVDVAEGDHEIDPEAAKALIADAEDRLKALDPADVEQRFAFETQLATARARLRVYESSSDSES